MRANESEADYKRRVARVQAATMARLYLVDQAEYMTQRKIEYNGPLVAKQRRNYYRRLAAKWMVKAYLLK